jgi:hypothetical protein
MQGARRLPIECLASEKIAGSQQLPAVYQNKRQKLILAKTCTMRIPSAADAKAPYGVVGETAAVVIMPKELERLLLTGLSKLG